MVRNKLQRNMPSEPEVFCFVHHSHAATAELRQNAVVRNRLPEHVHRVECGVERACPTALLLVLQLPLDSTCTAQARVCGAGAPPANA